MQGMMMHRDLRIIDILTYAAEAFPDQGIVSARDEGDVNRLSYPQVLGRVSQLAHGLKKLGIEEGDRVATLAWNGHRHFELYYGISGIGAVCHTLNPRLPAEQMSYILNHAQDSVLCVDLSLIGLVEALKGDVPEGMKIVVMTDRGHTPDTTLDVLCYEELLDGQPTDMDWPEFPETTAAGLCYTSGTTGNPKGALYSHRSTLLHALYVVTGHRESLVSGRRVLPVVPLFHVNAWGLPFTAPLAGMTMVMPGRFLDGASLFDLMEAENVFSAWGVPTVWAGLQAEIEKRGNTPPKGFEDLLVGGSAAPRAMIEAFDLERISLGWKRGIAVELQGLAVHADASRRQPPILIVHSVQALVRLMPLLQQRNKRILPLKGKRLDRLLCLPPGSHHNESITLSINEENGGVANTDSADNHSSDEAK